MRVVITGATGLVGRALRRKLESRPDMEILGAGFSRASPPVERLDLTDRSAVHGFLDRVKPDFIVHLAADRKPESVESNPDAAWTLNVEATSLLARECATRGIFLLLASTDYVFDGSRPPYFPDSKANPLNSYGRQKLQAEKVLAEAFADAGRKPPRAAVLRLPLLYGQVESLGESAVTTLASLLLAKKPAKADNWAHRYPVHADDVAEAVLAILDSSAAIPDSHRTQDGPALYQLSGEASMTKYDMVLAMGRAFGRDVSFVAPVDFPADATPRPFDCRLDSSRLRELGYYPRISFDDGIRAALEPWFRA